MKKRISALFTVLSVILLFTGCKKENLTPIIDLSIRFHLSQNEMIVDVDKNTTSFTIEGEWEKEVPIGRSVVVSLDSEKTTAKHNIHFINEFDEISKDLIFEPIYTSAETYKKAYSEVRIIPENITEPVEIYYTNLGVPQGETDNIKVILRPKQNR